MMKLRKSAQDLPEDEALVALRNITTQMEAWGEALEGKADILEGLDQFPAEERSGPDQPRQ